MKPGDGAREVRDVEQTTAGRSWLKVLLALALAGLGASIYLSVLHWQVHNVPGHVSFCALSERVNCDTVAMSKYSIVAALPLSYWGMLFYTGLAILLAWGLASARDPWPWGLVSWLNAAALGVSVFLLLLSEIVIHSFCIMCISLYVINLLSAVCVLAGQRRIGIPFRTSGGLLLLALVIGMGAFWASFPRCLGGGWVVVLVTMLACVALIVGLNHSLTQARVSFRQVMGFLASDLAFPFQRPAVGIGLSVLIVAALVTMLLVTPLLYPRARPAFDGGGMFPGLGVGAYCDEPPGGLVIAGGVSGLEHGVDTSGFHFIGARNPQVVIVEYSDYECPYCRKAHEIVRKVVREHSDWVRLVHVHMPLDQACNDMVTRPFHHHACDCAIAAICAAEQDAFWPMNDRLFIRRGGLDRAGLADLASSMGLDREAFSACQTSNRAARVLEENLQACKKKGIRPATPTFTIGSQVVMGLKDEAWWSRAIQHFRKLEARSAP